MVVPCAGTARIAMEEVGSMKWLWIGIYAAVLIWSGVQPKDPLI